MAEGARLESVYTVTYRGFDSLSHRHIKAKGISILLIPFAALGPFWDHFSVFLSAYVRIKAHHFRYSASHTLRVFWYPLAIVFFDHRSIIMTKLTGYPLKRNVTR